MSVALVVVNEISNSLAAELPPKEVQAVKKSTTKAKAKTTVSKPAKVVKKGAVVKKVAPKATAPAKKR